jgi:hypothetical protein
MLTNDGCGPGCPGPMREHDVYPGPLEEAVQTPSRPASGERCEPDHVREHRKVRVTRAIERTGERDDRVFMAARIQSHRELERERLCTTAPTSPYDMQHPHEVILPCRRPRRELPDASELRPCARVIGSIVI